MYVLTNKTGVCILKKENLELLCNLFLKLRVLHRFEVSLILMGGFSNEHSNAQPSSKITQHDYLCTRIFAYHCSLRLLLRLRRKSDTTKKNQGVRQVFQAYQDTSPCSLEKTFKQAGNQTVTKGVHMSPTIFFNLWSFGVQVESRF